MGFPMVDTHIYRARVRWTGDRGTGTSGYRDYGRDHVIETADHPVIAASSSTGYGMDPTRYNPEELVVAALSSCHMLWYLHLCAVRGVVVRSYRDDAEATLSQGAGGSARLVRATLRPQVTLSSGAKETALALHHEAHAKCYVANSMNFPVTIEPTVSFVEPGPPPSTESAVLPPLSLALARERSAPPFRRAKTHRGAAKAPPR